MTNHSETDTEPTLLFEKRGGVATLTLNRPAARNVLTTGDLSKNAFRNRIR